MTTKNNKGIFDTTDLEKKEDEGWCNTCGYYVIPSRIVSHLNTKYHKKYAKRKNLDTLKEAFRKGAIEERQRLRAEVEKVIDKLDKDFNYKFQSEHRIGVKELKKMLGLK